MAPIVRVPVISHKVCGLYVVTSRRLFTTPIEGEGEMDGRVKTSVVSVERNIFFKFGTCSLYIGSRVF
jgi:hypothetical protein